MDNGSSLAHRIAQLDDDTDYENTVAMFGSFLSSNALAMRKHDVWISPLMVACDRNQAHVVKFLVDEALGGDKTAQLCDVIGRVYDKSQDGNTAVHLAASSGSISILKDLARLAVATEASTKPYSELAHVTNSHGDTPIMMACLSSSADFVGDWLALIFQEADDEDSSSLTKPSVSNHEATLWKLLRRQNQSRDSAISLASGFGQVEVLKLLLKGQRFARKDPWPCLAQHGDLTRAEASAGKLDQLSKIPNCPTDKKKELEERLSRMKTCLGCIRDALSEQAESVAADLANEAAGESRSSKGSTKPSKTKKKDSRRKKSTPKAKTKTESHSSLNQEQMENPNANRSHSNDDIEITQLHDGIQAVIVKGSDAVAETAPPTASPKNQSPDQLLRDRFTHQDDGISAVMDALCLDVSMLLQTPHGMALLSPCQLDAVAEILAKQQNAVQQARAIQTRLRAGS